MDNTRRKLFLIKQSGGCKFVPKSTKIRFRRLAQQQVGIQLSTSADNVTLPARVRIPGQTHQNRQ